MCSHIWLLRMDALTRVSVCFCVCIMFVCLYACVLVCCRVWFFTTQAAQRLADATYMGTWKTLGEEGEEEEQEQAEEEERLRAEAQLSMRQRRHTSTLPAV